VKKEATDIGALNQQTGRYDTRVNHFHPMCKEGPITLRPYVVGLMVVGLLAGCSGTEPMADSSAGEVGTRGLSQVQEPISSQPGAQGQSNLQAPTFPQKFDVRGPELASFGFAVTQPGPVTVDVQGQGVPVLVTLQTLGSPLVGPLIFEPN
jgi:hypothetical protein